MKTYLNYSQKNQNINNNLLLRKHKNKAEQKDREEIIISRENKVLNRPARAISFGGSADITKGVQKVFNKTVEFVYDNEAAYNAIYSVIVAGMLKPLFVLNMPGSEDKDKQIVATKNFLQAFIGGFLGLTVGGGFVKKAIDVVKTNLKLIKGVEEQDGRQVIKVIEPTSTKALEIAKESLFKKGKKAPTIDEILQESINIIKNFNDNHLKAYEGNKGFLKQLKENKGNKTLLGDAFEVLWKNSTGALTAICKAKISTILLPPVMAFLFAKKNAQRAAAENAKKNILTNNSSFRNEQENFKKMMNKNTGNISFGGNILTGAIDGAATLIEKMGMSKAGEKAAKLLSKTKKPSARMSDVESFLITGYWLQNTARSKKIEPSQKLGLNVHSALVTVVSSTCAFIIDYLFDGLIDKSKNKYKTSLENIAKSIKANPEFEIGETLEVALKDAPDVVKMGIKNKVVALLDAKSAKDGLDSITDADIKSIIDELRATKAFKDFDLDESLIKKAISSLKRSEPIKKGIFKQAEDMIGAKDVAKKMSMAIGNEEELARVISKLTTSYGKKLSKFKSLTIFTLVVRFLVPVLMVPVSGKMKKKVAKWYEDRKTQKN